MKPLNTRTRILQELPHFTLVIRSNNTEDRSGLGSTVVRREFFRTSEEAAARMKAYENGEIQVSPTKLEAEKLFPWTDGLYGPFFTFTFSIWETGTPDVIGPREEGLVQEGKVTAYEFVTTFQGN